MQNTIACASCDLLFDVSDLPDGGTAICSRCGSFLTRREDDAFQRISLYSASALIMLLLSCAFPFMQFKQAGIENTMTLPQTVAELWTNGRPWLASIVAAFIIVVPGLIMLMTQTLAILINRGRYSRYLVRLAGLVFQLKTWSMAEVFFIGVLVSLVKIMHMATVVLGVSFWSYAAFTVFFVMTLTHLDRYQGWQRIEALKP